MVEAGSSALSDHVSGLCPLPCFSDLLSAYSHFVLDTKLYFHFLFLEPCPLVLCLARVIPKPTWVYLPSLLLPPLVPKGIPVHISGASSSRCLGLILPKLFSRFLFSLHSPSRFAFHITGVSIPPSSLPSLSILVDMSCLGLASLQWYVSLTSPPSHH